MSDQFTEVTHQSWFSRIGNAFKGILVGLILFIIAFPLLFWNEGRAVKRYKTLKEGSGAVISTASDQLETDHEGKLVHTSGKAVTEETLSDDIFGISIQAIKLKRNVEVYQWKEQVSSRTKKKMGGGTVTEKTYSYSKTWSSQLINSGNFKKPEGHQNPGYAPYPSKDFTAQNVTVGAYTLSASLVNKINNTSPLPLPSDTALPGELTGKANIFNNAFYLGQEPASPQIGDTRITFQSVNPTDVSLIAKQVNNSFEPYQTKAGGKIELLDIGTYSANEMFESAQASNKMLTWILRFVGIFLMFMGLNMILKPLSVMADVLPILGNIVGAGTGLISFLVAFVLSLTTISIAWIVYRPLLGIVLIVISALVAFTIKTKLSKAGDRESKMENRK